MKLSACPAITEFEDVKTQLSEIGITEEIVILAISAGLRERKKVTKFHPVTTAGSRMWEEVIAWLRIGLISLTDVTWRFSHEKGLSLTYNKASATTLVVSSGNKNTGFKDELVKTKNAKGPSTLEYVGRNLSLFDDLDDSCTGIEKIVADPNETWVLLYFVDEQAQEIRYELSLPKGMHQADGKLKIDEWENRIIFTPVPFSSLFDSVTEPDFSEDIDFTDIAK
jgi:hypothetical protein